MELNSTSYKNEINEHVIVAYIVHPIRWKVFVIYIESLIFSKLMLIHLLLLVIMYTLYKNLNFKQCETKTSKHLPFFALHGVVLVLVHCGATSCIGTGKMDRISASS